MRTEFKPYPEGWVGTKWITYWPWKAPGMVLSVPHRPACYVVYLDGQLTYVGQTTDLYTRLIRGHLINYHPYGVEIKTPWGLCKDITIKAHFGDRYGDWAMRELRLIHRLRPKGNCVGSTRPRRQRAACQT